MIHTLTDWKHFGRECGQYWTGAQMFEGKLPQRWEGESLLQLMIFITLGAVKTVYGITCLD